jgi:preprotein translocase subunit SecB
MADQDPGTQSNGSGMPESAPQAATLAQYIKDLSVESPNAPACFQWQSQPQLDVQFNIAVDRIADEVHEVVLKVEVSAKSDQGVHFLIDLSYAGLFGLRNIPEDALPPFLLMEAPRLIFPFARQIISDASQQMGFPALMLDPIDFSQAYMAQLDALEAQAKGAEANGNGAPAQPAAEAAADDE